MRACGRRHPRTFFRPPNAAAETYARWEQAHAELQAALHEPEAGL